MNPAEPRLHGKQLLQLAGGQRAASPSGWDCAGFVPTRVWVGQSSSYLGPVLHMPKLIVEKTFWDGRSFGCGFLIPVGKDCGLMCVYAGVGVVCVNVCLWSRLTHTFGSQRRVSGIQLSQSCLISLRQGPALNLELSWQSSNPSEPLCLPLVLGVHMALHRCL